MDNLRNLQLLRDVVVGRGYKAAVCVGAIGSLTEGEKPHVQYRQGVSVVSMHMSGGGGRPSVTRPVPYTPLRAHGTVLGLVCRLLLEKKKHTPTYMSIISEYEC